MAGFAVGSRDIHIGQGFQILDQRAMDFFQDLWMRRQRRLLQRFELSAQLCQPVFVAHDELVDVPEEPEPDCEDPGGVVLRAWPDC